jgi:hypothetical protein
MLNFKEWLYLETLGSVKDFLTDPQNKDKTFNELIEDFQKSGGKVLNGKYGFVFVYPTWDYVVKLFSDDACYLTFARFAYSHPHPSFPKLYGPPQKIVPFYKREYPKYYTYISRIEKLHPISTELAKSIYKYHYYGALDASSMNPDNFYVNECLKFIEKNPNVKVLYEGLKILLAQDIKCQFDESPSNIMQRANGDLVWSDPLWYGETPYTQANALSDLNFGDYDYDEPKYIQGGEIFRKKRIHKKKIKHKPIPPDKIPF